MPSMVAFTIKVGALFHGGEGGPALGINNVGAFKGFGHGVGLDKTAAASGRVVLRDFSTSGMTSYPSGWANTTSMPKLVMKPMMPLGHGKGLP